MAESAAAGPAMAKQQQFGQEELCEALKYHFNHAAFRPFQLEAIQATLSGRDSLLILPTGGGKSMTFQLPALAKSNCFTVVVGPLMALAKDQVDTCLDLGIDARVWNSDTSEEAKKGIQSDLVSNAPEMRLLYTTPESLRHPNLRGYLKEACEAGTLLSFAIDEAHCVSEWGHDFRPAYLELATLKAEFPNTPIAAMTASCTPTVESGIIQLLKLQDPLLVKGGFNRPNMQYTVLYKELINGGTQDGLVEHLVEFIKQRQGQCGIVYARLRATCDWLGTALGSCDLDVGVYHAGKDAARRRKVQSDWCQGGLDIVVATVAFGMGIDRADVRWVVHWDVPASLEGYYQESGRAGRDGAPSEAVLYASGDDLDTITKLERGSRAGSAAAVARFSCQGGCKRKRLLEYFAEKRAACGVIPGELRCDYCSQPAATRQLITQWEQQLQRKAIAHMLREQRRAAGLAADSDDDDAEAEETAAAAAATAAAGGGRAHILSGPGDGTAAAAAAAATSSSRAVRQQPSKPRPGLWAPARAHCSSDVGVDAAAAVVCGSSSRETAGRETAGVQQDENEQPGRPAAAAAAGTASGAAHCISTDGVLLPQQQQQQEAVATAAAKPQLKRRHLSRHLQPWGAFKAPRMSFQQPSDIKQQPAAAAAAEDVGVTQQQEEEAAPTPTAAVAPACHAVPVRSKVGLSRGRGFQPPFRR